MFENISPGDIAKGSVASCVILLVVAFFGFQLLTPEKVAASVDAAGCAQDGKVATHILVLVDNTDAWSPPQITEFQQTMRSVLGGIKPNDMITVASITGEGPRILFSRCSPERGERFGFMESLNRPDDNWLALKAQFERAFQKPLEAIAAQMPLNKVAPVSPIVESLREVSDNLGGHWSDAASRKLILFSDLMENTASFSQYNIPTIRMSFAEAAAAAPALTAAPAELRRAEVYIHYLEFPDDAKFQQSQFRAQHHAFWRDLIAADGGDVASITISPWAGNGS